MKTNFACFQFLVLQFTTIHLFSFWFLIHHHSLACSLVSLAPYQSVYTWFPSHRNVLSLGKSLLLMLINLAIAFLDQACVIYDLYQVLVARATSNRKSWLDITYVNCVHLSMSACDILHEPMRQRVMGNSKRTLKNVCNIHCGIIDTSITPQKNHGWTAWMISIISISASQNKLTIKEIMRLESKLKTNRKDQNQRVNIQKIYRKKSTSHKHWAQTL